MTWKSRRVHGIFGENCLCHSVLTEFLCVIKHEWLANVPDKKINIQKYLNQVERYILTNKEIFRRVQYKVLYLG